MAIENSWLILGITFGVLFIWFGFIIALCSQPMARGVPGSWKYNYRPWQPKFVKAMTDEEHDKFSQKYAKWILVSSVFMIAVGLFAVICGVWSIMNPLILAFLWVIFLVIVILAAYVHMYVSRRKMHKADKK